MSTTLQTLVALLLVALSALALIRRLFFKKENHSESCGGCPTDKFKAKLKRGT